MGVYIKGMEMPKKGSIEIRIYSDGRVINDPIYSCKRVVGRAVHVPPHGRLIDADALADVFRGFIAMYDSCPFSQLSLTDKSRRDELQSSLAEVINAPTVIEAEEGE